MHDKVGFKMRLGGARKESDCIRSRLLYMTEEAKLGVSCRQSIRIGEFRRGKGLRGRKEGELLEGFVVRNNGSRLNWTRGMMNGATSGWRYVAWSRVRVQGGRGPNVAVLVAPVAC